MNCFVYTPIAEKIVCMENEDSMASDFEMKMMVKSDAIEIDFKSWGSFRIYLKKSAHCVQQIP